MPFSQKGNFFLLELRLKAITVLRRPAQIRKATILAPHRWDAALGHGLGDKLDSFASNSHRGRVYYE
jgi:hypothetical protein